MKHALLLAALLAPAAAMARDCPHTRDDSIDLDLTGVRTVVLDLGSGELVLDAGNGHRLQATACASHAENLDRLTLEQHRDGDTLTVKARHNGSAGGLFLRPTYAHYTLRATLPADLDYRVRVGSGEADVRGLASLDASVGSGDLEARGIAGTVKARVGSGDISLDDIGALDVHSVGSGDLEGRRIRGDVRIGSVGSGDIELADVGGSVTVGSIGSGDVTAVRVTGDVTVRSLGSGDVDTRDVQGRVSVPRR